MGGYDTAKKEFQSLFRELTFAGYGIVFISHSTEKTFKDEKGEEYQQIAPALPNRPYDIINKMVDIIGYIREIEDENGVGKRYIFFRGDKRFFAKSRFRYIAPRVEFSYDNIVNAIYEAIDEEVASSGGEASNADNPYTTRTFEDLMDEAKVLWGQLIQRELVPKANEIIERVFGKPLKFSEMQTNQKEQLEQVLSEVREIL